MGYLVLGPVIYFYNQSTSFKDVYKHNTYVNRLCAPTFFVNIYNTYLVVPTYDP